MSITELNNKERSLPHFVLPHANYPLYHYLRQFKFRLRLSRHVKGFGNFDFTELYIRKMIHFMEPNWKMYKERRN